jgi:hypothetical protein
MPNATSVADDPAADLLSGNGCCGTRPASTLQYANVVVGHTDPGNRLCWFNRFAQ